MKFKTDENFHPDAAELLRKHGHDVLTVWDQNLRGASDDKLTAICSKEQRAMITLDLDFADIMAYPPGEFPGLIVLRLKDQSRKSILSVMEGIISLLISEPLPGKLWLVDEKKVRIRGNIQ